MPWLTLLHISAVIIWCGALLYLPILIKAIARPAPQAAHAVPRQWPRTVFVGVATPAALLAIASGTLLFVSQGLVAPWLIFKLAGVALLVVGHAICAMLVLRAERADHRGVGAVCTGLTVTLLALLLTIAWLVLHKPA